MDKKDALKFDKKRNSLHKKRIKSHTALELDNKKRLVDKVEKVYTSIIMLIIPNKT